MHKLIRIVIHKSEDQIRKDLKSFTQYVSKKILIMAVLCIQSEGLSGSDLLWSDQLI